MKFKAKSVGKFFIVVLTVVLIVISGFFLFFHLSTLNCKLDMSKFNYGESNVVVYDEKNQQLTAKQVFGNDVYTKLSDIPQYVIDAFVSVEDKRFFEHNGIDVKRIIGAAAENLKSMSFKEGASTITQQLIKNSQLTNEKSFERKFAEIKLATELEKKFTKNQILEMYLNSIYFGNKAYGINEASNVYFNKSPSQLTISEGAVLAGLINAPNALAPNKNTDKCLQRRNLVLNLMLQNGKITKSQYEQALNEKLDNKINGNSVNFYPYGMMAISETSEILGISVNQIKNSSLKIFTFLNTEKQQKLPDALNKVSAKTVNGKEAQKIGLLADNKTLGVEAFCGFCDYNPYFSKRQIGSVAKPIVSLAPTFEQGLAYPCSLILDEKTDFGGYLPKNINESYDGWVSVRDAMRQSKNVPAVKLMNNLNKEKLKNNLTKLNWVKGDEELNLSMALGNFSNGLTAIDVASAYAMLANNGRFENLKFVKEIKTSDGKTVYKAKNDFVQVFREDTAYLVTDVLKDVVKSGTAKKLDADFSVAGKTGTVGKFGSKNNVDALFCSYTPDTTLLTWYFSEYNDLLEEGVSGSTQPVLAAKEIYKKILSKKDFYFKKPDTVVELKIDKINYQKQGKVFQVPYKAYNNETFTEIFSVYNKPPTLKIYDFDTKPKLKPKSMFDYFLDYLKRAY